MAAGSIELLDLGLSVARWGANNAAALTGFGLAIVVLGHRAFRPVAALLAGIAGAWFASWALAHWVKTPPLPPNVIIAGAAVLIGVAALAAPSFGLSVAAGALGFVVGRMAAEAMPEHAEVAVLATMFALVAVAAILALKFPWIVTSIVGGGSIVLGVWGWVGASGASPSLFRLPVLWASALAIVIVLCAGLDRVRDKAGRARAVRRANKADEAAKRRREEEQRLRYAKYME